MILPLSRQVLPMALGSLTLVTGRSGAAETTGSRQLSYSVTRWTAEHGLPQSNIKALAQTRDGYLWIGTLNGLVRFDGLTFTVFDHSNSRGMTHDSINDLAADAADNTLWMATEDGLIRYQNHSFRAFTPAQSASDFSGQLWTARDGGVWFSSGPGKVALARGETLTRWEFLADQTDRTVRQLAHVVPDGLLVQLQSMIYRFDLRTNSLVRLDLPVRGMVCFSFFQDVDRSLWLCTERGLWHKTAERWALVSKRIPNLERVVRTSDGQVWATQGQEGRSSLQWIVNGHFEPFRSPEFPAEANVTRMFEDREGNLWVGTTSGLIRLQPRPLKTYSRQDGLASDNVLAVACDAEGSICVGTADGVSMISNGKIKNLSPPDSGSDWYRVAVLLADKEEGLWVGWRQPSLARFRQTSWKTYSVPAFLGNTEYLKALQEDREGRLWAATGEGVACRKGDQWSFLSTTNGLSHKDVRVIHQDRHGDIWFGTYGGGLNRLHQGKLTSYTTTYGSYNNRAWWIHEDAEGIFWVATQDGLNRFVPPASDDNVSDGPSKTTLPGGRVGAKSGLSGQGENARNEEGRFFTFTKQHGLHENVVNNIQEDASGFLWLSGLSGVYRVSRSELNDVAAGRGAAVHCIAYGEADGMLNSECNGGDNQPAGCKDRDGRIYFPTAQGVVQIDPTQRPRSEVPPLVVIEQVKADGEPIFPPSAASDPPQDVQGAQGHPNSSQPEELRIQPGKAHLEFQYTANTFTASERTQFRWRLFPAEKQWREATGQRSVGYIGLKPGHYQFDVIAANHHGVWSSQPASFAFILEPHFWQTWSFYSLVIAGTIGLGALLQAYRFKWQHRLLKLQEQQALANERARIARDLHDDLGTALTGLALQLDVARREAGDNQPVAVRFSQSAEQARDLADRMREVVWTINPRCDTLSGLATFIEQQVTQFFHADGLKLKLDFPEAIPTAPLGAQARHQLALGVREALTNVVRHARATEVVLRLAISNQELLLEVRDNGCGFQPLETPGHGLSNMRTRMEQVGGTLNCVSHPGQGTIIRFCLPLGPGSPGVKDSP
jgi:signal transduction histidine kinase/ligand-binding sensor domain-containing protein